MSFQEFWNQETETMYPAGATDNWEYGDNKSSVQPDTNKRN